MHALAFPFLPAAFTSPLISAIDFSSGLPGLGIQALTSGFRLRIRAAARTPLASTFAGTEYEFVLENKRLVQTKHWAMSGIANLPLKDVASHGSNKRINR